MSQLDENIDKVNWISMTVDEQDIPQFLSLRLENIIRDDFPNFTLCNPHNIRKILTCDLNYDIVGIRKT